MKQHIIAIIPAIVLSACGADFEDSSRPAKRSSASAAPSYNSLGQRYTYTDIVCPKTVCVEDNVYSCPQIPEARVVGLQELRMHVQCGCMATVLVEGMTAWKILNLDRCLAEQQKAEQTNALVDSYRGVIRHQTH
jgi:hypothetical protein